MGKFVLFFIQDVNRYYTIISGSKRQQLIMQEMSLTVLLERILMEYLENFVFLRIGFRLIFSAIH